MLIMPSRRQVLSGLAAGALAGSSSVAYGFGVEPGWRLDVTRYRPQPANWPRDLALRIAVVSDIHVGWPYMTLERVEEIVAATNALRPDLTVLLGDYPPGRHVAIRRVALGDFARVVSGLKAPLGVHAVLGNHDWWDDAQAQRTKKGPVESRRALEAWGIPVMENDVLRLTQGGRPFWLAGLGDQNAFYIQRDWSGVDDLPGTLAKVSDDAPVILLAHEPDIFPQVPARVSLTLSGHTHGGQVRLMGWSPITPSHYGNRYAYGHVVEGGRHLIVSGGLGVSGLPVRLGVPPEVVLVEMGEAAGVA